MHRPQRNARRCVSARTFPGSARACHVSKTQQRVCVCAARASRCSTAANGTSSAGGPPPFAMSARASGRSTRSNRPRGASHARPGSVHVAAPRSTAGAGDALVVRGGEGERVSGKHETARKAAGERRREMCVPGGGGAGFAGQRRERGAQLCGQRAHCAPADARQRASARQHAAQGITAATAPFTHACANERSDNGRSRARTQLRLRRGVRLQRGHHGLEGRRASGGGGGERRHRGGRCGRVERRRGSGRGRHRGTRRRCGSWWRNACTCGVHAGVGSGAQQ
jgi:hypothetical protein